MEQKPSSKILFLPRILLILLVIADSIYLIFIESGIASCSVLGKNTCITILPVYSNHLYIPLPILGLFGFIFLLILTILTMKQPKLVIFRKISAFGAFIFSVYLLSYMIFIVHNICPFCLISFLLVSTFAFLELIELKRIHIIKLLSVMILLVTITVLGVYFVSINYQPGEVYKEKADEFINKHITLSLDYRSVYEKSEKPLIVYIYSPNCQFCHYFVSEVLTDSDIQKTLENYEFYVLNIEHYNAFLKTISGKIKSYPSLVIWKKDGKQRYLSGLRNKDIVKEFLNE